MQMLQQTWRWEADDRVSVLSVKGKKVLHIDRNDHYGGYVPRLVVDTSKADLKQ